MRIPGWAVALLLLTHLFCAESHMLHYLHLKKFLTAVAFARALGKRPTILPIPVPIPIPIAQNEVIKIPVGGGGKTMILDGQKGGSKGVGVLGPPGIDYPASSPYGYSVPGVINLSSMKASDSNVINLASALGSGSNGGNTRIIVLGGQGAGNPLASAGGPSVIRLNDIGSSNLGGMNFGAGVLGGNGLFPGVSNYGDLDSAFSLKPPLVFQQPYNLYMDKPRKKFPLKFRGRRTHNNPSGPEFHNQKYRDKTHNRYISSQEDHRAHNEHQSSVQEKFKKPIPVGERFTFRR